MHAGRPRRSWTQFRCAPSACYDRRMTDTPDEERIVAGDRAIHDTIQRQVAELLANSDLSEEEKSRILIALACPCCGASGLSFSVPLRTGPDEG